MWGLDLNHCPFLRLMRFLSSIDSPHETALPQKVMVEQGYNPPTKTPSNGIHAQDVHRQ